MPHGHEQPRFEEHRPIIEERPNFNVWGPPEVYAPVCNPYSNFNPPACGPVLEVPPAPYPIYPQPVYPVYPPEPIYPPVGVGVGINLGPIHLRF